MSLVRKSFNIEIKDLDEAKRLASAQGMTLFHYLQQAVKEKNAGTSTLELMQEMEDRLVKQMAQLRTDTDRTRVEMRDDFDAFAEQLNEQNQKLLKTTDAQIRAFITLLREELAGPDEPAPKTGWSPGDTY